MARVVKSKRGRSKPARRRVAGGRAARATGNGLASRPVVVPDAMTGIEGCYKRGWTDGLPVIPPTEPAIRAMLRAGKVPADAVVGEVRSVGITAEKVAINAVLAGGLPAYFPPGPAGGPGGPRPPFRPPGAAG